MTVTVSEIQRVAPDILLAIILDGEITHGGLVNLATAYPSSQEWAQGATTGTLADMSTAAYNTWTVIDGVNGFLVAPDKLTFRTMDSATPDYLDREAILNVAGYGTIGGLTVTNVYYRMLFEDQGFTRNGSEETQIYRVEHYVYLHLSGVLADGTYTIPWPDLIGSGKYAVPADHEFTLNEKTTICPGIHINQNGYGLDDERKHATYHQWLPGYDNGDGREGMFDPTIYNAWTGAFYLIDKNGAVQHEITAEFRIAGDTLETYSDLFNDDQNRVASLNNKIAITAITKANPGVVTTDGPHGFSTDEKKYLTNILGMDSANSFRRQVTSDAITVIDETTFSFGVNTTSFGTYTSGGFVHDTFYRNTVGTDVYNVDIGAITLPPGDYRIWLPGFGVTPLFRIDTAVWARLADYGMRGVVAHYCGVALDDRFGYERPMCHRPVSEGGTLTLLQSKLPLSWSTEGGGFVTFNNGAASPWITATEVPYWGGTHDAGDHDRRTQHLNLARFFLSVHEIVGSAANGSDFNVPKMSTLVTDGTYAGTDALPDAVQIAMFIIDFWRRSQIEDGSVIGGIESANTPAAHEPSWKERQVTFAYSHKDPLTAYQYAAAAAHLARVLADEGFLTLSATYQTSAVAAFDYAESVYADLDTLWAEEITLADGAGEFSATSWETYKATQSSYLVNPGNRSGGARVFAAASLYRLIDNSTYKDMVEDWWDGSDGGLAGNGGGHTPGSTQWDYANVGHAGVNATYQTQMRSAIINTANGFIASRKGNSDIALINTRHISTQAYGGFGTGSCPTLAEATVLVWAHVITGTSLYAEVLQAGAALALGNNPPNYCLMNGLGYKNPKNLLHEDSRAMGRRPPEGVCAYGWHHWRSWVLSFLYGGVTWAHWPWPKGAVTTNDAPAKLVEPDPGFMPMRQWLGNGSFDIPSTEYTNQQTHGILACIGLYLQGKEGVAHFDFQPKRIRLRMSAA